MYIFIILVAQSCLTLCDPMDYTVRGILQARILEWVAFPFSKRIFPNQGSNPVSHIAGRFFTSWNTREALILYREGKKKKRNQTLVVVSSCHWRERDKTSDTCSLFPPSGDPWPSCLLPSHEPKVEPRSPTLQGDSLLSEPPGRHGIDFPALRDLECVG